MATDHIADGEKVEEIVQTAAMGVTEVATAAAMEEREDITHTMGTTMEDEEVTGVIAAVEVKGAVTAAVMEEREDIMVATTMEEVVAGVTVAVEVNEAVIVAMEEGGEEGGNTTITTPTERVEMTGVTAVSWRDHKNSSRLNSNETMNTIIIIFLDSAMNS